MTSKKLTEKQAILDEYATVLRALYSDKEYYSSRIDELSASLNSDDLTDDEKQNAIWHIADYGVKNDACDIVIAAIEQLL